MTSSQALFPGIPWVESPLFDPADLTPAEAAVAQQLRDDGFAVLDFPDPEIDARIDRIKANLAPRFGIACDDAAGDTIHGERRVQDAWQFDEDVRAIATAPVLLALLGKLYGRPAFPFQTLNFPVGTQQAIHNDAVHFSSLPRGFMCGVWLALEDVGADAGPLQYYPGSHHWPFVSNTLIGRRGWQSASASAQDPFAQAWAALAEAKGAQPEPFLARKGQALIWSANLLHGGAAQTDPRLTRWSQVTHYFFDDCIYYTPAFSDEALGRLDIREPFDIATGANRRSSYLGEEVLRPASAVKSVSWWRKAMRGLKVRL